MDPTTAQTPQACASVAPENRFKKSLLRVLLHLGSLAIAAGSFVAFEHFRAQDYPMASGVSLLATAIFALTPLRDVTRILFAVEGEALHLAHALGGLAFLGLWGSGYVSGTPLLTRAAQLLMEQNHSPTFQTFATSLPEIQKLAKAGNAPEALHVLTDLVGKAEAMGRAPAGTSSRLKLGISLGLDAVERATQQLATRPETAKAARELQHRLAEARANIDKDR